EEPSRFIVRIGHVLHGVGLEAAEPGHAPAGRGAGWRRGRSHQNESQHETRHTHGQPPAARRSATRARSAFPPPPPEPATRSMPRRWYFSRYLAHRTFCLSLRSTARPCTHAFSTWLSTSRMSPSLTNKVASLPVSSEPTRSATPRICAA